MPEDYSQALVIINTVFIVLFAAEMFLKIVGLGFWTYLADKLNLFDAIVVVISLIELCVPGGSNRCAQCGCIASLCHLCPLVDQGQSVGMDCNCRLACRWVGQMCEDGACPAWGARRLLPAAQLCW